jgi:hypothetical protein
MTFDFIKEKERVNQSCEALSITPTTRMLIVSIASQEMALLEDGKIDRIFKVSTSRNPPSGIADSYGTPLGLHKLADFIGDGEPDGMVFKGRVATGKHYDECVATAPDTNLITTRIIRLQGLEPGKNQGVGCDTYDRYVYIHGTNHEAGIGKPFSAGCILMLNDEAIELFDRVKSGDLLTISEK